MHLEILAMPEKEIACNFSRALLICERKELEKRKADGARKAS